MNEKQKKIIISTAIVILAMTLYPPFHGIWQGRSMNFGYSFIFSPPNVISLINSGTLLIQYIMAGIIGGFIWFLAADKK